jgi:hypothetical protein
MASSVLICLQHPVGHDAPNVWRRFPSPEEGMAALKQPRCRAKCVGVHLLAIEDEWGFVHVLSSSDPRPPLEAELWKVYRRPERQVPVENSPAPAEFNSALQDCPSRSPLPERTEHVQLLRAPLPPPNTHPIRPRARQHPPGGVISPPPPVRPPHAEPCQIERSAAMSLYDKAR